MPTTQHSAQMGPEDSESKNDNLQTQETLMEEQKLLRALLDLSPDAVVVIDPHDPNVSWPIIDCNVAACKMNGFFREELIGHSIDVLNITEGTQAERDGY